MRKSKMPVLVLKFLLMEMLHLLMISFKEVMMKRKFQIQIQMNLISRRSQELLMKKGRGKKKKQGLNCSSTLKKNLMNSDCQPKRSLKKKHLDPLISQISNEG